mmetsp:Transcript_7817/g.21452  ORF Transcript_7817/g.21452 Transcript_7817/m.21452 type:complete len:454 (-) Transcript_7817:245-1606(-)
MTASIPVKLHVPRQRQERPDWSLRDTFLTGYEISSLSLLGRPVLPAQGEFESSLTSCIDALYLVEQDLLWDIEVCEIGRQVAKQVLEGVDVALAVSHGKGAAWKLEHDALESLRVRFASRDSSAVSLHVAQHGVTVRRQRASAKLFSRLESIESASRDHSAVVREAMVVRLAMDCRIFEIQGDCDRIAEQKNDLSEFFYVLQECLTALLSERNGILVPKLDGFFGHLRITLLRVCVGKMFGMMCGVASVPLALVPIAGLVCVICSFCACLGFTILGLVARGIEARRLVAAFALDDNLCSSVHIAAKNLAAHLEQVNSSPRVEELLLSRGSTMECSMLSRSRFKSGLSWETYLASASCALVCAVNIFVWAIDFKFKLLIDLLAIIICGMDLFIYYARCQGNKGFLRRCMDEVDEDTATLSRFADMVNTRCEVQLLKQFPVKALVPNRKTRRSTL